MNLTRREVLSCGMAALGVATTDGSLIKSICGGRNRIFATANGEDEEEMYKELLIQILSNGLPPETSIDVTLPSVRKYAFANLMNLKHLIIRGVTSITNTNEYFVQGSSCETVELPDLVSCNHFVFWSTPSLKTIVVPKLKTNMTNLCYIGNSSLTDVYINESTCEEIMAIRGFPGMAASQNTNYANIVFHGCDGNVVYDSSTQQWVAVEA